MTVLLNLDFPNEPMTAFEMDLFGFETETVESMSGVTFRNARRQTPRMRFRLTLHDEYASDAIQTALNIKNQAKGQLFGFYFTNPLTGVRVPVAFTKDDWTAKIEPGTELEAAMATIDVELEQVLA